MCLCFGKCVHILEVSTSKFFSICNYAGPFIHSYLDAIERAVSNGDCLLLENIGENVDPVLDPLLGRLTIKKGKYIKIGDKEVEYHPDFGLILQVNDGTSHGHCTLLMHMCITSPLYRQNWLTPTTSQRCRPRPLLLTSL